MALPFSALALLGNGILQSLASLKYGNLGGRNVDLLLGAGVAADAGGAALLSLGDAVLDLVPELVQL